MNKVYPITAGLGVILMFIFDFVRTTMKDARSDRRINDNRRP